VVVQTAVVHVVAQEMVHAQVEDQRLDPVAVQLAIANQDWEKPPGLRVWRFFFCRDLMQYG